MWHFLASVQNAVATPGPLGLAAAAVWGALSILLSPCALVLIPMVMGWVQRDDGEPTTARAALVSLAFSSGVFVNILLIGGIVVAGGAAFAKFVPWLSLLTAVLLVVFGLGLLGAFRLPGLTDGTIRARGSGLSGALTMGLFSGLISGPCSFGFMAPLLLLALNSWKKSPSFALGIVLCFAAGYALLLLAAGVFSRQLSGWLQWSETSNSSAILSKICGVLVLGAGVWFFIAHV